MAELATIARPYAEALFKSGADGAAGAQLAAFAAVAADPQMRQFAANPKVSDAQVLEVLKAVAAQQGVPPALDSFLGEVVANGRLPALPEIAAQFHALVNAQSGVSDAVVYSAFPIDGAQLAEVSAALERRFGRRLDVKVELAPELIGGIRVVVGDEVLDTSVAARLQQMKAALTA